MGKNGFSAVEMLFTLVLVGVLTGIGVVAYRNIQDRAEEAAHNKDQVVLQQVMESFRITGGNMSAILANSDLSDDQKAAALTLVMKGGSKKETVVQTGQVTKMMSDDLVIVRYTGTDKTRLVPTPPEAPVTLTLQGPSTDMGESSIASGPTVSQPAFIVTKKTTILGSQAQDASSEAQAAADLVLNPSIVGAHYALGSQYIWTEDSSSSGNSLPSSNDTNPGAGVVGVPGSVPLKISGSFSSGVLGTGSYTYDEYQGSATAKADIYVYRADGKMLFPEDISFGTVGVKMLMSNNNASPQFTYTASSDTVPASQTQGLGPVPGYKFSINLKDLAAFGNYQPGAEDLSYMVQIAASPTELGKLGHPGIAPLQSKAIVLTRALSVTHPTKLKLAFAFDKTGNDGKGDKTAGVANMVPAAMEGDDFNLNPPLVQDGTKVDYNYRYYQFGKPAAENIKPDSIAYVAIFRDDNTPAKPEEIQGLVLSYNGRDIALKDMTPSTENLASAGAPPGSATYSFRLSDFDGIPVSTTSPSLEAINKAQNNNTFKLMLKSPMDLTWTSSGSKGRSGAGSIIGVSTAASDPVYINVNKRTASLVVQRHDAAENYKRYATASAYNDDANNKITMNILRSDGLALTAADINTGKSKAVFNGSLTANGALVSGVMANGLFGSSASRFTLTNSGLLTGPMILSPRDAADPKKGVLLPVFPSRNFKAPAGPALSGSWTNPQAQLQFYFYPSDSAKVGTADKDPIAAYEIPANGVLTGTTNVGRVFIFADWLPNAVPYDGTSTTNNNNTQTTTPTGGTKGNATGPN